MTPSEITRMANQIADYFRAYPAEEAEAGVAQHIIDFWDPRMRAELRALVEAGGEGFSELALTGAKKALAKEAA